MRHFICARCNAPASRTWQAHSCMCLPCKQLHRIDGRAAAAEVTKAINNGELLKASAHDCKDCGATARDWDHRDYLRPLDVEPVCRACNQKRPTAFDSVYRPADETDRPSFAKTDRRALRYAQQAQS